VKSFWAPGGSWKPHHQSSSTMGSLVLEGSRAMGRTRDGGGGGGGGSLMRTGRWGFRAARRISDWVRCFLRALEGGREGGGSVKEQTHLSLPIVSRSSLMCWGPHVLPLHAFPWLHFQMMYCECDNTVYIYSQVMSVLHVVVLNLYCAQTIHFNLIQ